MEKEIDIELKTRKEKISREINQLSNNLKYLDRLFYTLQRSPQLLILRQFRLDM